MFENLHSLLIKEYSIRKETAAFFITNGYCESWREHSFSDEGLRRYSTAKKWQAYQAGEISREKAVEFATARRFRELDKQYRKDVESLESAAAVPDVQTVTIHVQWKRSSTWGYNPHASVIINGVNRYEGRASGCGYDKRTAAVGDALNRSAVIRKMLYQAKERALQAGYDPDPVKLESNRECIAYGAGYGTLPYFEGGVGMNSFISVFDACGLKLKDFAQPDKGADYYYFERGENK